MKTLFNKTFLAIFAIAGMLTILASCSKEDETVVYGNAKVKVVNTVQTSEAQDFYQNDTKITTTPVAYGSSSDYLTVKAGFSSVSFKNNTNNIANAQDNLVINTDVNATSFFIKDANTGNYRVANLADDLTLPAAGKARVRFVNLALIANGVGVKTASDAVVAQPLTYLGVTNAYATVDANTDLFAYAGGSNTTTTIPGATFASGKVYIIWFDALTLTTVQYHVVQQN